MCQISDAYKGYFSSHNASYIFPERKKILFACEEFSIFSNNEVKDLEKESFIEIIKQHRGLIYKVCHSYCSDPTDRKDLEQEILLQLWKSMGRFDGRVKLSTWMYKVALNTAIMFYRSQSRYKGKNRLLDASILSIPEEEKDEVYAEHLSLLYRYINQLGDHDRALILLYLDGIKQSEIADILGITESNVSSKINRIKKKLKHRVKST